MEIQVVFLELTRLFENALTELAVELPGFFMAPQYVACQSPLLFKALGTVFTGIGQVGKGVVSVQRMSGDEIPTTLTTLVLQRRLQLLLSFLLVSRAFDAGDTVAVIRLFVSEHFTTVFTPHRQLSIMHLAFVN